LAQNHLAHLPAAFPRSWRNRDAVFLSDID